MEKCKLFEIVGGMDFLHSHWIVHHALQPQNLVATLGTVKITDLGQKQILRFEVIVDNAETVQDVHPIKNLKHEVLIHIRNLLCKSKYQSVRTLEFTIFGGSNGIRGQGCKTCQQLKSCLSR